MLIVGKIHGAIPPCSLCIAASASKVSLLVPALASFTAMIRPPFIKAIPWEPLLLSPVVIIVKPLTFSFTYVTQLLNSISAFKFLTGLLICFGVETFGALRSKRVYWLEVDSFFSNLFLL
jgi:hypothetical protein